MPTQRSRSRAAAPAPSAELRGNALLAALPAGERKLLNPALELIEFGFKMVVEEPGEPVRHVWFPHSGVLSTVSDASGDGAIEVATTGREGFTGLALLLEAGETTNRTFAQIPGRADRLAAADFRSLIDRLPTLRRLMLRCTAGVVAQIAQGSACNRLHPVEQRCARWLLMTQDRVDGNEFPLTQEFLSQMLGVSRPSVSIAASVLQKAGFIRYVRGVVHVLDRPGLEAASCECYRVVSGEFRRLIGAGG